MRVSASVGPGQWIPWSRDYRRLCAAQCRAGNRIWVLYTLLTDEPSLQSKSSFKLFTFLKGLHVHVEVREKLCRVSSPLLPLCRFRGPNSSDLPALVSQQLSISTLSEIVIFLFSFPSFSPFCCLFSLSPLSLLLFLDWVFVAQAGFELPRKIRMTLSCSVRAHTNTSSLSTC